MPFSYSAISCPAFSNFGLKHYSGLISTQIAEYWDHALSKKHDISFVFSRILYILVRFFIAYMIFSEITPMDV
jgi:hypothetical protein